MLDRVIEVRTRNINLQANLVVRELFDLDGHLTIQAKGLRLPSAPCPSARRADMARHLQNESVS